MAGNNDDLFRIQYRALSLAESARMRDVKEKVAELLLVMQNSCRPGAELTLAQRKLQESVFWAVNAIID